MDSEECKKEKEPSAGLEALAVEIDKAFALQYDYLPVRIKGLLEQTHGLGEFLHGLAGNQYYSEQLAKKVFLLEADTMALSLRVEKASMKADSLGAEMGRAVLRKEKPAISKPEVDALKKEGAEIEKSLEQLFDRAVGLVSEMKSDFQDRHGTS